MNTPLPSRPARLVAAFPAALSCIGLGLRDGLKPRLILQSLAIWAAVLLVWSLVFWIFSDAVHALSLHVVDWIVRGAGALVRSEATGPAGPPGTASNFAAGVVSFLAFILLCLITARLLVDFFLMGTIRAIVRPRYPTLEAWGGGSWKASLRNTVGPLVTLVLLALPLMLVPVLNVVALFLLFNYLNVRGLVPDALEDIAKDEEVRRLIQGSRIEMMVLGALLVPVLMIPPLSLLAPSVLGASVTHLAFRRLQAQRRGQPV
ncbi:EI24 domain-containing protein [Aquabacterium sp. A7-Y]|uniref:EI24 domain-containing protein n=1 Tax=Aquabacterium sp. A7-Y TaxID=1349605 RepID=UPI00223E091B|nr:EI24 domain-containing protein [Aquabacterium sp. A7-Y]MCW7538463.1 EI24 domain-containing protein [Aquabacterium sp. A7-Y]